MLDRSANKRRQQTRDRTREWYKRSKLRDPIAYFSVPLPESIVHQLVAQLRVTKADDKPVSNQEWRRTMALVLSEIIKTAVLKKTLTRLIGSIRLGL